MDEVFVQVREVSNWGYWDSIRGDDREIREGQYRVRWADGTETVEDVKIHYGSMTYGDMGHTGEGPDNYAYVDKSVNGVPVKVKLRGLWICPMSPSALKPWSEMTYDELEDLG